MTKSLPVMNHCVTCAYWSLGDQFSQDFYSQRAKQLVGTCGAISDEEFEPAPAQSAALFGAYGEGGQVHTTAYFGCSAWESK